MLELSAAGKRYRADRSVLDSIELSSSGGELVAVVGAPRAGKTTLLRMIAGLELPSSGSVSVFQCELSRLRAASLRRLRTRMGILPQEMLLSEDDNVIDNVSVPLELRGDGTLSCFHRSMEVLTELGIGDLAEAPVFELSTSERLMVSVARALVGQPELIALDCPEDGLCDSQVERVARVVEERVLSGAMVISTSRQLGLLWQRVVAPKRSFELAGGVLVATGAGAALQDAVPNVLPFPITARAGGE